jgi:hypothetical protein
MVGCFSGQPFLLAANIVAETNKTQLGTNDFAKYGRKVLQVAWWAVR